MGPTPEPGCRAADDPSSSSANEAVQEAIAAAEERRAARRRARTVADRPRPATPPTAGCRRPDSAGEAPAGAVSRWEIVAILLAGVAAGTINTVVGSGTLITFPTLLAFGVRR